MKWRRQRELEPVDRTQEWEGLLHSFRTRSSQAMQRELYHRKARQRQAERVRDRGVEGFSRDVVPSASRVPRQPATPKPVEAAPQPEQPIQWVGGLGHDHRGHPVEHDDEPPRKDYEFV